MSPSVNTAANNNNQNLQNNLFQESSSTCYADCQNLQENVNITISNGSTVGGISLNQSCTADSLCTMRNQLTALTSQQLNTAQKTKATGGSSWTNWPGFQMNTTINNNNQNISNTNTQIINSACNASASNIQENINILVNSDSNVTGEILLNQTGNATANCTVQNAAKTTVNQSATSKQTATSTSENAAVIIVTIIVIGLVMIALVYLNDQTKKQKLKTQGEVYTGLEKALASGNITGQEASQFIQAINPKSTAQVLGSQAIQATSQAVQSGQAANLVKAASTGAALAG